MLRTSHFIIFVTKHPLACKIMNALGIGNVKVCLNTLGSKEARSAYVPALKEYLK